jgi:hypothetical protein
VTATPGQGRGVATVVGAVPQVALEGTVASRAKQREVHFGVRAAAAVAGRSTAQPPPPPPDLSGPLPRAGRATIRSNDGPELQQIIQEAAAVIVPPAGGTERSVSVMACASIDMNTSDGVTDGG